MEEAEDQEVEAILVEILTKGETLEEGEILEEAREEKIEEAIASLARNLMSSMEIKPK